MVINFAYKYKQVFDKIDRLVGYEMNVLGD